MKRVSVIGHFAKGHDSLDGQTIKTRILTQELCSQLGENEVLSFDTHGRIKSVLRAPLQVAKAFKNSKNIIMMPAHNGLRVFGRLLPLYRSFFGDRKLHYVVIGGWLAQMLKTRKSLAGCLKDFDGIYVETQTMKKDLEQLGFTNVFIMPNFKPLRVLAENELVYPTGEPYKLCTFSRVMKEKGIEDAICAVKAVNARFGRTVYTLDIYGQVDVNQSTWFEGLQKEFSDCIKYCGTIAYDESVSVLKKYFMLLFPTFYAGEGFAGTLIDAVAAGVPIIASDWKYNSEFVTSDVGILVKAKSECALIDALVFCIDHTSSVLEKKNKCLAKAREFTANKVISSFCTDYLD